MTDEFTVTTDEIDTAFKVLEFAREHATVEDIQPEKTVFNDAHHFLQEMQGYWEQEGIPVFEDPVDGETEPNNYETFPRNGGE